MASLNFSNDILNFVFVISVRGKGLWIYLDEKENLV